MTVEVRTDPPISGLIITGSALYACSLMTDPWDEKAGQSEKNRRIAAGAPQFPYRENMSDQDIEQANVAYNEALVKYNIKTSSAISVYITGMNEAILHRHIESFTDNLRTHQSVDHYRKGTRFGGKDSDSMNSVVAFMLKAAMPVNIRAEIGVKMSWQVQDVVRYAVAIREGLARSGVKQLAMGYSGAKTGLMRGFGVFKVPPPAVVQT